METRSKALCARFLRRADNCAGCLHFKECEPLYVVSKLAIAEKLTILANEQLPRLKNYLAVNSTHYYRLTLEKSSDSDILETQKEITSMGYIITEMGCLSIGFEEKTVIKARKVQGLKEASL